MVNGLSRGRAPALVQAPPPPALNERSDAPPTTGAEDGTPSRLAEAAVEAPTRVQRSGCEPLCISAFKKHRDAHYITCAMVVGEGNRLWPSGGCDELEGGVQAVWRRGRGGFGHH